MKNIKLLLLLLLAVTTPALCMEPVPEIHVDGSSVDPAHPTEEQQMDDGQDDNSGDTSNDYGIMNNSNQGSGNTSAEGYGNNTNPEQPVVNPQNMAGRNDNSSINTGGNNASEQQSIAANVERGLIFKPENDKQFRGKTAVVHDDGKIDFYDNFQAPSGDKVSWGNTRSLVDRFNDYWRGGKVRKEIYALSAEAESLEGQLHNAPNKQEYDEKLKELNIVVKELEARRASISKLATSKTFGDHMQKVTNKLNSWGRNITESAPEENSLASSLLTQNPSEGLMKHASMRSLHEAEDTLTREYGPDDQDKAAALRKAQEDRVGNILKALNTQRDSFMNTKEEKTRQFINETTEYDKHIQSLGEEKRSVFKKQLEDIKSAYDKNPPDWYTKGDPSTRTEVDSWINSLSIVDRVDGPFKYLDKKDLNDVESRLRKGHYKTDQQKYELRLLREGLTKNPYLPLDTSDNSQFEKLKRAMNSSKYEDGTLNLDNLDNPVEEKPAPQVEEKIDSEPQGTVYGPEVEPVDYSNQGLQQESADESARQMKIDQDARQAEKQNQVAEIGNFDQRFKNIEAGGYGDFKTKDRALSSLGGDLERFLGKNLDLEPDQITGIKKLQTQVEIEGLSEDLNSIKTEKLGVARVGNLMEKINTLDKDQPLSLQDKARLKEIYTNARTYAYDNDINLTDKPYLRSDWLVERQPEPQEAKPTQSNVVHNPYGGDGTPEGFKKWRENSPRVQEVIKAKEEQDRQRVADYAEKKAQAERDRAAEEEKQRHIDEFADQLAGGGDDDDDDDDDWHEASEYPEDKEPTVTSGAQLKGQDSDADSGYGDGNSLRTNSGSNDGERPGYTPDTENQLSMLNDLEPYELNSDSGRSGMNPRDLKQNTADWKKAQRRAGEYTKPRKDGTYRNLDDLRDKDYYSRLTTRQKEDLDIQYSESTGGKTKADRQEDRRASGFRGTYRGIRSLAK